MTASDNQSTTSTYSIVATVAVVALLVLATTAGVSVVAAQSSSSHTDGEYAVIQGDECFTIDPLGNGSQSVEAFYDYRTPNTEPSSYKYSSYGTTHLQRDNTSSLFLYEGRDGLSLVLLHEQLDGNTSGGAVTMQFDGLPEDGEWVVEDDRYEGRDDEFTHDGSSSRITWVYTEGRNDGAAFRGDLTDDARITIDPAFNDAADFRLYEGNITDWQTLSAADDGYERTSLEMTEPIEIRSGGCPSAPVTADRSDDEMSGFGVTAVLIALVVSILLVRFRR